MMWAILGDIEFEVIGSPSGFEHRFAANFAEHARIAGKPLLEAVGGELEEIQWTILLHERLHDVATRLRAMRAAVIAQEPLALVLGDGSYLGPWLIVQGQVTTKKTDARGRVVSAEVQIGLREYTGEFTAPAPRPGLADDAANPLVRPGLVRSLEQTLTGAQQLARAARTAENVMRNLDQTAQWARRLDAVAAIGHIPAMLGSLAQAGGSASVLRTLGGLVAQAPMLMQLGENLTVQVQTLATGLRTVQSVNIFQKLADASQVTKQALQQFDQSRGALLALTADVAMRRR